MSLANTYYPPRGDDDRSVENNATDDTVTACSSHLNVAPVLAPCDCAENARERVDMIDGGAS